MKALIKHLLKNNLDEILNKSYLNCHVKGLHSIMLLDSPGKTIRLYVADSGNELNMNTPGNFIEGKPLSLAFHAHHCNLTLQVVKGFILNWEVKEVEKDGMVVDKWLYQSGIKHGDIKFQKIQEGCLLQTTKHRELAIGDYVMMPANQIHTVFAHKTDVTAWMVYEGQEDLNYKSYAWSNTDLNHQDFSDLYQTPTENNIRYLLTVADLL